MCAGDRTLAGFGHFWGAALRWRNGVASERWGASVCPLSSRKNLFIVWLVLWRPDELVWSRPKLYDQSEQRAWNHPGTGQNRSRCWAEGQHLSLVRSSSL